LTRKGGGVRLAQVKSAMVEAVLNKAVPLAIAQVADRALDESEKIETDVEQMAKIFNGPACEPTGDMEFAIGVDLVPEVTWTGDYKAIEVTVEAAGNDTSAANEVSTCFAFLVLVGCSSVSHGEVLRERGSERGVCESYWQLCLLSPHTPNRRFGFSAFEPKP